MRQKCNLSSFSSLFSSVCVMLRICDGILSSAVICATLGFSHVGSAEYQIRAKDLHQNLTRTWHWQLQQQQSESCQNQSQAFVSFITKVFVGKSSRTICENPLDLLIKGAFGGDSQPMLTPSTMSIPWLHLLPLCLSV